MNRKNGYYNFHVLISIDKIGPRGHSVWRCRISTIHTEGNTVMRMGNEPPLSVKRHLYWTGPRGPGSASYRTSYHEISKLRVWVIKGSDRSAVKSIVTSESDRITLSIIHTFETSDKSSDNVSHVIMKYPSGPVSISDRTSYRKISWRLKAARLIIQIIASLWILTGISAAFLPQCLSNFRPIGQFLMQISRLRDLRYIKKDVLWDVETGPMTFPTTTFKTLNVGGPSYLGLTMSISWLLMPWLLTSPGQHQKPWYWLCRIGRFLSYLRKDFNYLRCINVEKWHKM